MCRVLRHALNEIPNHGHSQPHPRKLEFLVHAPEGFGGFFFPSFVSLFSFGEVSSMTKTSVQARYDHPHIYYPGCPLSFGLPTFVDPHSPTSPYYYYSKLPPSLLDY